MERRQGFTLSHHGGGHEPQVLGLQPELICKGKPKVDFVCVHNFCHSQYAENWGLIDEVFPEIIRQIEKKILKLKAKLQ